jgi:hypothetical protein
MRKRVRHNHLGHQGCCDKGLQRNSSFWRRAKLSVILQRAGRIAGGLFFFMICFQIALGQETTSRDENPPHRNFGPLKKSLLIPGWGQIAEHRYFEGLAFVAAEACLTISILTNNHRGNEAYRLYRQADNPGDAILNRNLTEKYDKRRNIGILAAASVWAVNLLDISLIVRRRSNDGKRLDLMLLEHDEVQFAIALRLSY